MTTGLKVGMTLIFIGLILQFASIVLMFLA